MVKDGGSRKITGERSGDLQIHVIIGVTKSMQLSKLRGKFEISRKINLQIHVIIGITKSMQLSKLRGKI